jgi:hypothetical protein
MGKNRSQSTNSNSKSKGSNNPALLFSHLLFLNTFYPDDWAQKYMDFRKQKMILDEDATTMTDEKKHQRTCFHGMKYMLGLYDWDDETKQTIDPFPTCYGIDQPQTKEAYDKAFPLFREALFAQLW